MSTPTTPRPRAHIGDIPAYVPGKPPTPRPGLTAYKLSSNENPYPPLPGVVEAATRAVEVMNPSFPSGHAMLSAVVFLTIGVLSAHFAQRTRFMSWPLQSWSPC